jgi:hypothetical protein
VTTRFNFQKFSDSISKTNSQKFADAEDYGERILSLPKVG